jgi:hypothetical protein
MTDSNIFAQDGQTLRRLLNRLSPLGMLNQWFGRLVGPRVPEGYEDEHGFHYGKKRAATESLSQYSFEI